MSIGGATLVGGSCKTKINTPGAQELDLIGTGHKNGLSELTCREKKKKIACKKKKKSLQAKKIKKTYNTRDSLVVPYQSTDRAQGCLTSQFGWDAVLSPWYDRKTRALRLWNTPVRKFGLWQKKVADMSTFLCFLFLTRPRHCRPFI